MDGWMGVGPRGSEVSSNMEASGMDWEGALGALDRFGEGIADNASEGSQRSKGPSRANSGAPSERSASSDSITAAGDAAIEAALRGCKGPGMELVCVCGGGWMGLGHDPAPGSQ